jgi:enterochelin esterase-like enzyme
MIIHNQDKARSTHRIWIQILLFVLVSPSALADRPVTAFEDLLRESSPNTIADSVNRYAARNPENPVIEGQRALLLFDPQTRTATVVGDFNAWGRYAANPGSGVSNLFQVVEVGQTRWRYVIIKLASDARLQYALSTAEGELTPDPRNPGTIGHFGMRASNLVTPEFSSYAPATVAQSNRVANGSRLLKHNLEDAEGKTRAVTVYLPSGYQGDDGMRYPFVVFNDGTAYIEQMQVTQILDQMIASGSIPAVIAIFSDPAIRREDYRRNPVFRDYMDKTLLPWAEKTYPLSADLSQRAYIGSSRGSLAVIDFVTSRPGNFGHAGLLSPAFSPTTMLQDLPQADDQSPRLHVRGGDWDHRFGGDYWQLLDRAMTSGYRVRAATFPEGHNQLAWRGQLPSMLMDIFPSL